MSKLRVLNLAVTCVCVAGPLFLTTWCPVADGSVDEDALAVRMYALYPVVSLLAIYAWRGRFVCTRRLVLLSTLLHRHDLPGYMMGVPGLNPWNVLFIMIVGSPPV